MLEDEYLGDGFYASFDGWQIELYASNGISKTDAVFLDPSVLHSFMSFAEKVNKIRSQKTEVEP